MPTEITLLFKNILTGDLPQEYKVELKLTALDSQNLSKALQYIPKLKILELNNCFLGEQGIRHLSSTISELCFLEVLSLGNNNLQQEGARLLGESLTNLHQLKVLRA